jgi:hypothetical protein
MASMNIPADTQVAGPAATTAVADDLKFDTTLR